MNRPFLQQVLALAPLVFGALGLGLFSLCLLGQPLPIEDEKAACLVGAAYCVVASTVALAYGRISLFSFPGVFLAVSGYYLVGLLLAFPLYGDAAFATWYRVDLDAIVQAIPLVMLGFTCFLLGSVMAARRHASRAQRPASEVSSFDLTFVRFVGWAMYGGAIVVILSYTVSGGGLYYAISGGYYLLAEQQYQVGGSALLWGSLVWFLPWGIIILSAAARTRKDLLWLAATALPANIILVIVGDRGGLLVLDVVLLTRATLLAPGIRWWQALGITFAIALAVPTLMVLRQTASKDWTPAVIKEAVTQTSSDAYQASSDPLSAFLIEGGTAYRILMGAIVLVPSGNPFHHGADYVKALPTAIPFFSRLFPDTVPENAEWLKEYLDRPGSPAGLGFLQIAEAYLQFGTWGVAGLYLILGFAVTLGWQHCRDRGLVGCHLAFLLIVMNAMLLWIRNECHIVVKPVVWGFALLVVAPALFRRRSAGAPRRNAEAAPARDTCQVVERLASL